MSNEEIISSYRYGEPSMSLEEALNFARADERAKVRKEREGTNRRLHKLLRESGATTIESE